MHQTTNRLRAILTISKYSLLATLRSPTSVVFSLLFPIIFITVFGSIVDTQAPVIKLAIAPGTDTGSMVYKAVTKMPYITMQQGLTAAEQREALQKGRVTAILSIKADGGASLVPHYAIGLQATSSSGGNLGMLQTMVNEAVNKINQQVFPGNPSIATVSTTNIPGRVYKTIDFILPGQLGFSLLMAGVYGSSFLLFGLRQSLALKRLRATPVSRTAVITGEMLSRLFFQVISFIIMVALGYYAFQFTLVNGMETFLEMLAFSLFGLVIFMGIGFIISGLVQNENAIAPIANTIVLPQILLCGLFFPIESYPHWLHQVCSLLPLTLFVDGLRKIAFEGAHLWQLTATTGGLVVWNLIMAPLAVKSFRWE